jgi:hypothetical protein
MSDQRFRNAYRTFLKRLGVSMVSPFILEIPRVKKIPAALLISEVLMDSNNF